MSEPDELKKATNGYNAAITLWSLASQQIYSRFSTMLTANSIVVAAISVLATRSPQLPRVPLVFFSIVGVLLCVLWFLLIVFHKSIEDQYRNRAKELEKTAVGSGVVIEPPKGVSFFYIAYVIILLFVFLHFFLIWMYLG